MGLLAHLVAAFIFLFRRPDVHRLTWATCLLLPCKFPSSFSACTADGTPARNTTGLKVVLPSVGQTGTTSVMQAIRQLGFRSYHIEERNLFAPAASRDHPEPSLLAHQVSRCRVEALSLEPLVDALANVVQVSPDARYILTWRDYPSWAASTVLGGAAKDERWGEVLYGLIEGQNLAPWMSWFDAATGAVTDLLARGDPFAGEGQGSILTFLASKMLCVYNSSNTNAYERGTFTIRAQEEAYLSHINEIRQLVPAGRLLEFNVQRHGWAELAAFLGRPAPPAGTAFPRTRSMAIRTNDINFYRNTGSGLAALAVLCLLSSVNFVCLVLAVRAAAWAAASLLLLASRALFLAADLG